MIDLLPRLPAVRLALLAAVVNSTLSACSSSLPEDAGPDAGDAGRDGGDAGPDAGLDAGDAGPDAGRGAGLAAGAVCSADDQCRSQVCGVHGAGHCCSAACATSDPTCGATDCADDGHCIYPSPSTDCGTHGCDAGVVHAQACDGQGDCAALPGAVCPGRLGCLADQSACAERCIASSACAPGLRCRTGVCVPRQIAGYCETADDCQSGPCLNHTCCAQACPSGDTVCAAPACDLTSGACLYPGDAVPCGALGTRSCQGGSLESGYCDSQGQCSRPTLRPCDRDYACNAATGTCDTTCADAGSPACAPGFVCGVTQCCPAYLPDAAINIDPLRGSDLGCCGGANAACLTVGRAMQLLADSKTAGGQIAASNDSAYVGPPEHFPIHLGWGVTVNGGAAFDAPDGVVFEVYPYPGEGDAGPVTLNGGGLMNVGFDLNGNGKTRIGVQVGNDAGTPSALQLSQVLVYGSETAVDVAPGSQLILGPNFVSTGQAFPVYYPPEFGGQIGVGYPSSGYGVRCRGTAAAPASVSFAPTTPGSTLGQFIIDTTGGPEPTWSYEALGNQVGLQAVGQCSLNLDQQSGIAGNTIGIQAIGPAKVNLVGTAVGVNTGIGLQLLADDAGVGPTVTIDAGAFENIGCVGFDIRAGSLSAANTTLALNHFDIFVADGGQLDLSAGGNVLGATGQGCGGAVNGSVCPADFPVAAGGANPGVALVSAALASSINASNTTFYDPAGSANPTIWKCPDLTLTNCTCAGPDCVRRQKVPSDGASFVGLSADAAPFVTPGYQPDTSCPASPLYVFSF